MKIQLSEESLSALVPEAKNLSSYPRKKKKKIKKLIAKKIDELMNKANFEEIFTKK